MNTLGVVVPINADVAERLNKESDLRHAAEVGCGYDEVTVQDYIDSLAALEDDSDDAETRKRAFRARTALLVALAEADELLC